MSDDRTTVLAREYVSKRAAIEISISRGFLPTESNLLAGHSWCRGSIQLDFQIWLESIDDDGLLEDYDADGKLLKALLSCSKGLTHTRLKRVLTLAEQRRVMTLVGRLVIYSAFIGGWLDRRPYIERMCEMADVETRLGVVDAVHVFALTVGIRDGRAVSPREAVVVGMAKLSYIFKHYGSLADAIDSVTTKTHADLEMIEAVLEDRAEIKREPVNKATAAAAVPETVVVVPAFGIATKTERTKVRHEVEGIAGKALSLVPTGDVSEHMRKLVEKAPHLSEIFDMMLRDTAMSKAFKIRPWLLVGGPGSGKSSLARDLAEAIGVPISVFKAEGSSDGMFAGTPAGWASAGISHPLRAVAQSRVANPIVCVDEVEKAADSPRNGSLKNALLGFLERSDARAYLDPALEVSVDLSHVNYILTANSLEGVPAPLRDRCRIVRVPDPGPEHIGVLTRRIVDDLARTKNIDPRWWPPFAQDELEQIGEAWGGGSIRRLKDAIEAALDHRASPMGNC